MDWTHFSIFFIGVFGLFIWNRTESRSDMRHMMGVIDAIKSDASLFQSAMAQETKDFHGRLERLDAEFKAHLMNLHNEGRK